MSACIRYALAVALATATVAPAAQWRMKQRDIFNTGRADFTVPAERQGGTFFDDIIWQQTTTGDFRGSSVVFCDGAGPGGADLAVITYTWVNGALGVDRHTGARFWRDTPGGGDTIGKMTPALSNDGGTVYVVTDNTPAPCIAWSALTGPAGGTWDNGDDTPNQSHLSILSPTVAPDDRIFLHQWSNTCYAGIDSGTAISQVWAAATTDVQMCYSDVALYPRAEGLVVVACGRAGRVTAYHGDSGAELWTVLLYQAFDGSPTIDPNNGNIYANAGFYGDVYAVALDIDGNSLWATPMVQVHEDHDDPCQLERAQSTGCLSHDGATYYFQTVGPHANGKLYAVGTADGSVKWSYPTGSSSDHEITASCPIVTRNGILVVGNNYSGQYLALRDDGDHATLLDAIEVEANLFDQRKRAQAAAVIAPDGKLYLPLRTVWTTGNGDGETPSQTVQYCLTAFDLSGCDERNPMDFNGDCRVDLIDLAEFSLAWMDCRWQPPERCYQ